MSLLSVFAKYRMRDRDEKVLARCKTRVRTPVAVAGVGLKNERAQ